MTTTPSPIFTVYEESVRRLEMMIAVIALRVVYEGLSTETAQAMIANYSQTLRKLRIEFNYVGEDNIAYHNYLRGEFVMGEDPLDINYDPASGPSDISYAESESLRAKYAKLLLTSESNLDEVH